MQKLSERYYVAIYSEDTDVRESFSEKYMVYSTAYVYLPREIKLSLLCSKEIMKVSLKIEELA